MSCLECAPRSSISFVGSRYYWVVRTTKLQGQVFAYVRLSAVERRSGSSAVWMLSFLFLLLQVVQLMQCGKVELLRSGLVVDFFLFLFFF